MVPSLNIAHLEAAFNSVLVHQQNPLQSEISMFEGRSVSAKKALIRALYANIQAQCDISTQDVEITIFETPKQNWGIRGLPGDELQLDYNVDV